jgi:catechol 2,3-dioxygenase-like lactoylglutathione lyase family enzyme
MATVEIEQLDHLVLTVADIERTCAFYSQTLGMQIVSFGAGRKALTWGASGQRINLHQQGREFEPKAARPTPGSADLCFITSTPLGAVIEHLAAFGVAIELGPVPRSGCAGALTSVYFRDPDLNLIEVANRAAGPRARQASPAHDP